MRPYEQLVAEAEAASVDGWGFGWLDGRATEQRPPWKYARLMAEHLAQVDSALDIDTGGGEVLNEAPVLPGRMAATEGWPPNLARARELLTPRRVQVVGVVSERGLPFSDAAFDLVTSRHPVAPNWPEIHRVLRPGGRYLAQHVGPGTAFELVEAMVGRLPQEAWLGRDTDLETQAARESGLVLDRPETFRARMEFHDIGAVVWTLRKCVWWVPDFTAARYESQLRGIDEQLRAGQPFVAHSTRHLVSARRPRA